MSHEEVNCTFFGLVMYRGIGLPIVCVYVSEPILHVASLGGRGGAKERGS